MIPTVIIVDDSGPEEGADIHHSHVLVREVNYEKVYNGLTTLMGNVFQSFTKEEYVEWLQRSPVERQEAESSSNLSPPELENS